jgi:hypothetical protein
MYSVIHNYTELHCACILCPWKRSETVHTEEAQGGKPLDLSTSRAPIRTTKARDDTVVNATHIGLLGMPEVHEISSIMQKPR